MHTEFRCSTPAHSRSHRRPPHAWGHISRPCHHRTSRPEHPIECPAAARVDLATGSPGQMTWRQEHIEGCHPIGRAPHLVAEQDTPSTRGRSREVVQAAIPCAETDEAPSCRSGADHGSQAPIAAQRVRGSCVGPRFRSCAGSNSGSGFWGPRDVSLELVSRSARAPVAPLLGLLGHASGT
jgi:hypothetical protein